MIVYEWLTGAPAFSGSLMEVMWKQINTPPPALRSSTPTNPEAAERVILKALAKDPKDCYPAILAFADALAQAITRGSDDITIAATPDATTCQFFGSQVDSSCVCRSAASTGQISGKAVTAASFPAGIHPGIPLQDLHTRGTGRRATWSSSWP
jgi:hypothetical protein